MDDLYLAHLKGSDVISVYLIDKKEVSIGRSNECDIVINSSFVSQQHAKISMTKEGLVVQTTKGEAHIIHKGKAVNYVKVFEDEEIGIGLAKLLFIKADSPENAVRKAKESLVKKDIMEDISGLPIENKVTIGRSVECDIRLNYSFVSRFHALIERFGSKFYISDMGSKNGTLVNSKQISSKTELKENDKIQIGNLELEIINGTVYIINKWQNTNISCKNLTLVKNGQTIINNIGFSTSSGELVAVIGGSGEGKSTLIKLLSGFIKPTSGEILVNGVDIEEDFNTVKKEIGYVPQNDIVVDELSIWKNLYYCAKLRLPQSFTNEQITSRISKVLEIVELSEHGSKNIEQLSVSQRKRASIAVEILANPTILFLDEPTSGLDEQLNFSMIRLFKSIANRNKIVFVAGCDVKNLCIYDKVILINGGELIFYGTPEQLKSIYQLTCFEQIYQRIKTLTATVDNKTFTETKKKSLPTAALIKKTLFFNKDNPFFFQLFWLTIRYCEIIFKKPANLAIWILQAPIIAFITGLVFYNAPNNTTLSFVIAISAIWYSANGSMRELVKMDKFYIREKHSGLNTSSFILSVFLVLSVITVVGTVLFIGVLNLFGIIGASLSHLMLYSSMAAIIGTALGLLISSISNNTEKPLFILHLVIIPQLIFSGILVEFNRMTFIAREISNLTPIRWSFVYTKQLMEFNEANIQQYATKFFIFTVIFFIFTYMFQRRKDTWTI